MWKEVVNKESSIGSVEPPLGSMASLSRAPQQWATFARVWYLLDGKMQPPGKLAALASVRLQGLHKPVYHQLSDCGDHVVIMNTRHIAFSGNKWEQKVYSSHTGYPGGFKQVTAAQLHRKDPVAVSVLHFSLLFIICGKTGSEPGFPVFLLF